MRTAPAGSVPVQFTQFLAGRTRSFAPLISAALADGAAYQNIYAVVAEIPYGETRTYGEVAAQAGTHPRVVGNAMAWNPTALIIPCHRVVAAGGGKGGFTPDPRIKEEFLRMEMMGSRQNSRSQRL